MLIHFYFSSENVIRHITTNNKKNINQFLHIVHFMVEGMITVVSHKSKLYSLLSKLNKRDLAHAIHQNLFRTHTKAATSEHLTIKLKPLEEFSRRDK